jgi:hypothetical protein
VFPLLFMFGLIELFLSFKEWYLDSVFKNLIPRQYYILLFVFSFIL